MKRVITFLIFFLTLSSSILLGHSGRTDGNGGHNDRINGGYHYHHGMGPHQHPNGVCPYKNDSNDSNDSDDSDNSDNFFWYFVGGLVLVGGGFYVVDRFRN